MEGPLTSYFHEEQTFSRWIPAAVLTLIGIPVAAAAVESLFRPDVFFPSVGAIALFVPIGILFFLTRLVVDVTTEEIRIAFHLLWPTRHIPLDDVARAHATAYNALADYGGWGVRLGLRKGWAFNTGGTEGVLVETKRGTRIMIGSRRPRELEAAIAHALADRVGR